MKRLFLGYVLRNLYIAVFVAVLPIFGLIAYLGLEGREQLIRDFKTASMDALEKATIHHSGFVSALEQNLATLEIVLQRDWMSPARRDRLLEGLRSRNPALRNVLLSDAEGRIVNSAVPLNEPITAEDRAYFRNVRQTLRFSVGEFTQSRSTGEYVLHFAHPIRDADGIFQGAIIAAVDLGFHREFFQNLRLPPQSAIVLLDIKGTRMLRHPPDLARPLGLAVRARMLERMAADPGPAFFQEQGLNGEERLVAVSSLRMSSWQVEEADAKDGETPSTYGYIAVNAPLESVLAPAGQTFLRNLAWLGLAAFMAAALARMVFARALGGQLEQLASAAERLGAGDLDARTGLVGLRGELGDLAKAFDGMAARLQAREQALKAEESKFRTVFESSMDLLGLLSPDGVLLDCNPTALDLICARRDQVVGRPFWDTPWWNDDPEKVRIIQKAVHQAGQGRLSRFETTHRKPGGEMAYIDFSISPILDEAGKVAFLLPEGRDISERMALEARLRRLAMHDPLTGLANRALLKDRLAQAIKRMRRRPDYAFALLFLDLNRFKVVNDSLGHAVGDALLKEVASRLLSEVRDVDTVARYGGDEFVVLLDDLGSRREVVRVTRRLAQVLRKPCVIEGRQLFTGASFGLNLTPNPDATPDELIRNANLAMRAAKSSGGGKIKTFTTRLLSLAQQTQMVENEMDAAIEQGQFHLVFQPIVETLDHEPGSGQPERAIKVVGFEALCRWRRPDGSNIPPDVFINVAEEAGKISDLGRFVLEEACRVWAAWREADPQARDVYMSVNVSPRQLSLSDFAPFVRRALERHGLPPQLLRLELTETGVTETSVPVQDRLEELNRLGVKLCVDDFGAGYSNLALLPRLPLSVLKIDLNIAQDVVDSPENQAVVRAVVGMAESMRLSVVVEGVETPEQREVLRGLGCVVQQGYLYSRPLPPAEALAFARRT